MTAYREGKRKSVSVQVTSVQNLLCKLPSLSRSGQSRQYSAMAESELIQYLPTRSESKSQPELEQACSTDAVLGFGTLAITHEEDEQASQYCHYNIEERQSMVSKKRQSRLTIHGMVEDCYTSSVRSSWSIAVSFVISVAFRRIL